MRNWASASCPTARWARYLTGKIDESTTHASSDIRSRNLRFHPGCDQGQPRVIDLLETHRQEKRHAGAGGVGLAAGAEAADRADSRHAKLERLDENIGAVNVQLTADDLGEIADAMAQITVVGNRY